MQYTTKGKLKYEELLTSDEGPQSDPEQNVKVKVKTVADDND